MRRLLSIVLAATLTGLGCNSTGKKPPASNNFPGKDVSPTPFWDERGGVGKGPATPPREGEGILAGQLIDSYGKATPRALVNVAPADAGLGAKPIGVESDDQGYFVIKGLKPGINYFLTIRGEDGGKTLGGSAMASAPNTRLLIKLSEGNVSAVTPPPVPHVGEVGPFAPKDNKPKLDDPPTGNIPGKPDPLLNGQDQSWGPGKTPPASRPAPPPPSSNPNIADLGAKNSPPTISIPSPARIEPPPAAVAPAMSAVPANSSPIASFGAVQGPSTNVNFTLYDLGGNPIEFRHLSQKRLIVLDFWTTWCPHCIQKMPNLIELQEKYKNYIDVIGVACDETPWAKRVKDVTGIRAGVTRQAQRPINFPFYLEGEGQEGRVQSLYHVKAYPTMVVLDHTGKKIWQGSDLKELEAAIYYTLTPKKR